MTLAHKISAFNRNRKYKIFLELFKPNSTLSILDVGYSDKEYSATDNFLEKNYPFQEKITALGIDEPDKFSERYPQVKAIQYGGKKFPFIDKVFDICWSNAVLEHVGNNDDQLLFLKEIKRVSTMAFITTPNRYFPVEVHTRTILLHFLPKKIFERYLLSIGKKWATGNYMNLLSYDDIKTLLKSAGISNYRIIRNKILFFTLDFIIIINKDKAI